ncbi:hypothetical protein FGG08_001396 [Glutinoglossum americanum]|uniref:Fucose-specific lectin n=1 Tax=Glutinoglossum americanum TaxID=1670608 RepID=A0A9P8L0B5_9PEZI|nr:hypothetical protein FGG08_001396 [Glutinoglossum americanum]
MQDMDTRIYYQDKEGAIHERVGKGPATGGHKYSDNIRVPANKVRANTPMAVCGWGNHFAHIRLYYVDRDGYIREECWDGGWTAGGLDAKKYRVSSTSGFMYALCTEKGGDPRVGFQASDNPQHVTEAFYNGGWSAAVLMN